MKLPLFIANLLGYCVVVFDKDPLLASKEGYPYAEHVLAGDAFSLLDWIKYLPTDIAITDL